MAVAVVVVIIAALFVSLTGIRPAFDAYGWLVWGHQALHLNLNLDAAPSWKPLTFLFTFPYALFGRGALWLWMVTEVSAALAGMVVAGRIAYRLAGPTERWYAPAAAALFAGVGVLGIVGYGHYALVGYSDPMDVALVLGAIDCHLSGRRRWAWLLLILVALGRPEAWPIVAIYVVWSGWQWPKSRAMLAAGVVAIAALWLVIPGLASHSVLISSDIASTSTKAPLVGGRFTGEINNFFSLYELPMQLAGLAAIVLAVLERQVVWLVLALFALAWVAVEVAFVLHGYSPSGRYMFEPEAVMVVLAGAGVGRLLALPSSSRVVRLAGVAAVVALIVTIAPHAQIRARLLHNGVVLGQQWATQIHRLEKVIAREGGPMPILRCGVPVTRLSFQPVLAWELNQNVSRVGYDPPSEIKSGRPIVYFQALGSGWRVRALHSRLGDRARCAQLATRTSYFIPHALH